MSKQSFASWIDSIPKIPYLESDAEPIPGTQTIWLHKSIDRVGLTKFVRHMTRTDVKIESQVCSLSIRDVKQTAKELGLTPKQTEARIKAAKFTQLWNKAAIQFQRKLFDSSKLES